MSDYPAAITAVRRPRAARLLAESLAWAYDFPTRQLLPIAGLIAFYNERVDIVLDGQRRERPKTHFFPSDRR
jgi:hypothetical protein